MSNLNNTKKRKKIIIILIILILTNFLYPKVVKAELLEDLEALPAKILFALEKGILRFLNDIFTSENYHSSVRSPSLSSDLGDDDRFTYEELKVYLTPETIIKGRFIIFDADIFKKITDNDRYYDFEKESVLTGKQTLREIVAGWYYALRNFAIVALLSVLVYVGIRMILSTVAQDKAKYKSIFKDWLVALCLVVTMHYLMISVLNISSMITEAFGRSRK